jgi:8-oxo-dGTP diphosphatase
MHSNIAQFFLPKLFTFQQLQQVYDIILWTTSDVRNFRNFITKSHIVRSTKKKEENVAHRPATLYQFIHKDINIDDF